ncbi:hypothetical protein F5Y19DRAFT_408265 [Xylariaceae sp. FL1651]|nr:hypothetical protein F5Y19DRAFT_408265 [Xylariaceae sp. FL1651]
MQATSRKCQVISAPSRELAHGNLSIFLAGATSQKDEREWREVLIESLADLPLTIFNPLRTDWDATWREDISFEPFREQTEWELEKQEAADIVVVYFHPATKAPISLLELGLCAKTGKAIVVCPEGYWKRGNVEIMCKRYHVEMIDDVNGLKDAILRRWPGGDSST